VTEVSVAAKVLRHLGLDATGPPVVKATPAPEPGCDAPPEYDQVDPICEE